MLLLIILLFKILSIFFDIFVFKKLYYYNLKFYLVYSNYVYFFNQIFTIWLICDIIKLITFAKGIFMYNFASYKSNTQLEKYKNYLFIGPHPSDIDFACCGFVSKLISDEKIVNYLVCTKGYYATAKSNMSTEDFEKHRNLEAQRSADYLKVKSVTFLNYPNGGRYNITDIKLDIAKKIANINPDVIIAPDFANTNDLDADHIAVAQAVKQALSIATNANLSTENGLDYANNLRLIAFYWADNPNTYIDVTNFMNIRLNALSFHASLFPVSPGDDISLEFEYIKEKSKSELRLFGDISGNTYAEGYRVISKNGEGGYVPFNVYPIFKK